MRKIKRLRHLQKERQRLRLQRIALEHDLHSDWQDIRHSVAPATLARHALASGVEWIKEHWLSGR